MTQEEEIYSYIKNGKEIYDTVKEVLDKYKSKSDKWDALDNKLCTLYERVDTEGGDLCDIGELCATAFGYL